MRGNKTAFRRVVLLALLLACVMAVSAVAYAEEVSTSGTCGESLTWYIEQSVGDNPILHISGSGDMYDYETTGPWTDVLDSYFVLKVEDGVTSIGERAFYGSCVTEVDLPNSLINIGAYAFAECRYLYDALQLPDSLCWLGEYAFSGARMNAVVISSEVTAIPEGAFSGCSSLSEVVLPDSLQDIGAKAFESCKLRWLDIPENVTQIGERAFADNSRLKNIYFPGEALGIHETAFAAVDATVHYMEEDTTWTDDLRQPYGGALTWQTDALSGECGYALTWKLEDNTLTVSGTGSMFYASYPTDYVTPWHLYNSRITKLVIEDGVNNVGEYTAAGCRNLVDVELAQSVENIDQKAFYRCVGLENIQLPANLTEIEDSAFLGCTGLTQIQLPDTVTMIWYSAFQDCTNLSSVKFSNSLERILSNAFSGCIKLKKVSLPDGLKEISDGAFSATGLTSVTIPGSLTEPVKGFNNCQYLKKVTLETGITEIGPQAFSSCPKLTSVSIPGSVRVISNAFTGARGLTEITIPYGVERIGASAFAGCTGLTQIIIPDSVVAMESGCFMGCTGLKDVSLSKSMTVLDGAFFSNCTSLETLRVPSGVTGIEGYGFSGCTSLKALVFEGDAPTWGRIDYDHEEPILIYYPADNATWDALVEEYSGYVRLDFVAYTTPKAPGSVKVTNVASSGKNKISWGKVTGAVKYEIYRARSSKGSYSLIKTTASRSYTDTTAEAGKLYYYKIKAVTEIGVASKFSSKVSRRCDLPRPEISLSNVASSGKIKVSWKKIEGADKYEVYRATSKSGTYKLVKTTTGTSYTNTAATAGKTYYYKVKAIHENSNANSAFSSVGYRCCDLPRPNVSISLSSGKPKIKWSKVEGATEYKIYRATSKNGTYKLVKTTKSLTYTYTGAKAGTTYYFKVIAVHSKSSANSAYSVADSIKSK